MARRSPTRQTAQTRNTPHTQLWQAAASFAARKHHHQTRKDGRTPYFSHPVRVCMTVAHVFGVDDPVALCAALLHDTIEDTTTDYEDIEERFGPDVAACVAALTKNMALPESIREKEYDSRLAAAGWRAKLVKLADTYDNYCDVVVYPKDQVAKKRRETRDRCLRAIALTRTGESNDALHRAAEIVRLLIA